MTKTKEEILKMTIEEIIEDSIRWSEQKYKEFEKGIEVVKKALEVLQDN